VGALLLAAALVFTVDPRALPPGAPDLPPPGLRVNVLASEALQSDHLRALARPRVTLWLSTRGNVLADSTLVSLGRFAQAWVQMRAPFSRSQLEQLERLPRVGLWVRATELGGKGAGWLKGPRRLAIELDGPLDEALAARIEAVRPDWVIWRHSGPVDLLAWALYKQLPGRKLYAPEPDQLTRVDCGRREQPREPAAWVPVAVLTAAAGDVFPCGKGGWVQLEPGAERWIASSVLAHDPSAELVFDVGAAEDRSVATRRLLDDLEVK
jgi:hypothetical protein